MRKNISEVINASIFREAESSNKKADAAYSSGMLISVELQIFT